MQQHQHTQTATNSNHTAIYSTNKLHNPTTQTKTHKITTHTHTELNCTQHTHTNCTTHKQYTHPPHTNCTHTHTSNNTSLMSLSMGFFLSLLNCCENSTTPRLLNTVKYSIICYFVIVFVCCMCYRCCCCCCCCCCCGWLCWNEEKLE
jgi:hypothetical protein